MPIPDSWLDLLNDIYDRPAASALLPQLRARAEAYGPIHARGVAAGLTERDALLITYPDQVRDPGAPPLRTLAEFCGRHLDGLIDCLHLLPFFPSSSDDGFSVVDYRRVDPAFGTWDDIAAFAPRFRLTFDAVINHASIRSRWFQAFLNDDPHYRDFFIEVKGNPDLSGVVRPRALPLLTRFRAATGEKSMWTTFSADQADLNFANPLVLLEIVDLLLFYAAHGADFLRLDAIAYLWKEIGTACIHLPQTHSIIRLFRAVLEQAAPHVQLITETNVPHRENVSYFGDGTNEAQLVYNFALPPLVLHTLSSGDVEPLTHWIDGLALPSPQVTYLNFLASHDGIGLNPVRGLLPEAAIDALVELTLQHGGLVSYKEDADGSRTPYELNINFFDALAEPSGDELMDIGVARFMAAQAIMLALIGLPGIYFHSLFGSRGWPDGVQQTGRNRTINRQKLERAQLEHELADPANLRCKVFERYSRLLRARAASAAFHPHGTQKAREAGPFTFALLRESPDRRVRVLCLQNITAEAQTVALEFDRALGRLAPGEELLDLITGHRFDRSAMASLTLAGYQTYWLCKAANGQAPA